MKLSSVRWYLLKLERSENYILNKYTINTEDLLFTVITHTKRKLNVCNMFNICSWFQCSLNSIKTFCFFSCCNLLLKQQEVLERTILPTFLILFNNALWMTTEMYRWWVAIATADIQPLTVVFWEVAILLLYFYISFIYGRSWTVYKYMTLHKNTEFYTVVQHLYQHNLKISHYRHI
jgi:hypothetical protein